MNPIVSLLGKMGPVAQAVQQAKQVAGGMNPMEMLSHGNPQMMQVMQLINSRGGDPKTVFYQLAKERGVDPESILEQVRGIMK
jgi:hypothetical protein